MRLVPTSEVDKGNGATPDGGETDSKSESDESDETDSDEQESESDSDEQDTNSPTKRDPPTPDVGDEELDEPSCPSCGSTDYFLTAELPDRILDARPELKDYDRCCYPCSTTDSGDLSRSIEAYQT